MRSIWKGTISFGLVSIPIKVVAATENHSVSFHQVHTADQGRIRYRKVCELDEEEVPREEIGRGFETEEGRTVLLTDDDMAALPLPTAKTVEILGFVPAEEIDPIQLDRSYYLAADGKRADKPYVLLREALKRSGKVAVAKLAPAGPGEPRDAARLRGRAGAAHDAVARRDPLGRRRRTRGGGHGAGRRTRPRGHPHGDPRRAGLGRPAGRVPGGAGRARPGEGGGR